jgi:hypothetical protein
LLPLDRYFFAGFRIILLSLELPVMPIFPDFLPQDVQLLTETASVAFAEKIQRKPISVTVGNRAFTVDTAFVVDDALYQADREADREADRLPDQVPNPKPPILLLHGFDSSMFEFRRLMPKLAKVHPSFAVDLLGFGFTDRQGFDVITPAMIKAQLYGIYGRGGCDRFCALSS